MISASRRRSAITTALCGLFLITAGGCKVGKTSQPVQFASEEWSFHGQAGSKLTSDHYVLYTTHRAKPFVDTLPGFMESCWSAYQKVVPCQNANHKCESYLF